MSKISAGLALLTIVTLSAASPRRARAGNDDEMLLGNDAAMTGGAVTAMASDGAAIWYNPAGLMNADEDTVDLTGTLYTMRLYHIESLLASSGGQSDDGEVTEAMAVPTTISYIRPVNEHWRIALGVFNTQKTDASLQSTLDFATMSGEQTNWALGLGIYDSQYNGGASVAWEPHPRVRLGATMFVVYDSDFNSLTYSGGLYDPSITDPTLSNSTAFYQGSEIISLRRWAFRWNAGIQVDLSEHWILGATVFTPAYVFKLDAVVTGAVSYHIPDPMGGAPITGFHPGNADETALGWEPLLPLRARAGLAYHDSWGWVSADFDFQPRLENPALRVDREAVWNLRVGGEAKLSDTWVLGLGFFTDRSASPTLPSAPLAFQSARQQFYGGTVGVRFDTRYKLDENEDEDRVNFSTTLAFRYAHGKGHATGIFVDEQLAGSPDVVSFVRRPYTANELGIHLGGAVLF